MIRPLVYMRSRYVRVSMFVDTDGLKSFVAEYVTPHPLAKMACEEKPTKEECEKLLPFGWVLFEDAGRWRAKPMST